MDVLAAPAATFTVARVVAPSLKATVPQLIAGVTVALKVTDWP